MSFSTAIPILGIAAILSAVFLTGLQLQDEEDTCRDKGGVMAKTLQGYRCVRPL